MITEQELIGPEIELWQAAPQGDWVVRFDNSPERDNPIRGETWGRDRQIRAELIYQLATGIGPQPQRPSRGIRLRGIRVVGELNMEAASISCPLYFDRCYMETINLSHASALFVELTESVAEAFSASQLRARSISLRSSRFSLGVELTDANIDGSLDFSGGTFTNPSGSAISARGLSVGGSLLCHEGFYAEGTVDLVGARVNGQMFLSGGQFANSKGAALLANVISVAQNLTLGNGFVARGEVQLLGAHIGGAVDFSGGRFSNPDRLAIGADRLKADQGVYCRKPFIAEGQVRFLGADITGQFNCSGGKFLNKSGFALDVERIIVSADTLCRTGFVAEGSVNFAFAEIGGNLDFSGAELNPPLVSAVVMGESYLALNLRGAKIGGSLRWRPVEKPSLPVSLQDASIGKLEDVIGKWPDDLVLDGVTYGSFPQIGDRGSVNSRLAWLRRNITGYTPQVYNQLSETYVSSGNDRAARKVFVAKQAARSATLRAGLHWPAQVASRVWNWFLNATIGYGYYPSRIVGWLVALLAFSTVLFGYFHDHSHYLLAKTDVKPPPDFHPFLYSLDLLLPLANLKQRDNFVATGPSVWWATAFTLAGWLLGVVLIAGLSGIFKRD